MLPIVHQPRSPTARDGGHPLEQRSENSCQWSVCRIEVRGLPSAQSEGPGRPIICGWNWGARQRICGDDKVFAVGKNAKRNGEPGSRGYILQCWASKMEISDCCPLQMKARWSELKVSRNGRLTHSERTEEPVRVELDL
jgi:hypothetical protein